MDALGSTPNWRLECRAGDVNRDFHNGKPELVEEYSSNLVQITINGQECVVDVSPNYQNS